MATDGMTIKLDYGVPVIFAPRFIEGKSVPSNFGERAMFSGIDSRKLFLDAEDASDLERAMRELRIRAGEDFVRLTKIKHPRGGGHSIRVERVEDKSDAGTLSTQRLSPPGPTPISAGAALQSREEQLLEKSIELAQTRGAAAFITPRPGPDTTTPQPKVSHLTATLTGCFVSAIDAVAEAQRYAKTRDVGLTFTSEDVRAVAISAFIQYERSLTGGR